MSKNTLRWMTTRLPFITAVFVTLFVLAGWLSRPIQAAPTSHLNAKSAAQGQVAGPGIFDDYDPVFRYTGHWQFGNYYQYAYNITMHYTTDATARAALTFQGTGFILYRVTYANRGLMGVYIDGALYQTVNNYSAQWQWQVPLTINGLPDTVHTVEFANTSANTFMDIDAVRVLEGNATLPPPTLTPHPVTATIAVPPTLAPLGALSNVIVNANQPLIPQLVGAPNPAATSSSTDLISPLPKLKALIYSGEEPSSPTVPNLYTIDPTGTAPVQVSNTTTPIGFNYPVWSPDGKSIAFADANGELQILNIAAGTYLAPAGTTAIMIAAPVAWDPSGANRIAYIDDGAGGNPLTVVDFSGTTAAITQLVATTGTGTGSSQVSWSLNGKITFQDVGTTTAAISYVLDSCIASAPCSANPLALPTGLNSDPAWSPDGTKLAYVSNNDVYIWDGVNTPIKISNGTSSKRSPTWSADGTQLVYVENNTVLDLVGNANTTPVPPTPIHSAKAGTLLSVSWNPIVTGTLTLPTLQGLIYSGEDTGSATVPNLYTIAPDGTKLVQVSNAAAPGFNYPVWSPDGKSIAFADTSGHLQILNVATGIYRAPSTIPITITAPVAWDPSGAKRIAYIDAGTGNPLKVVDFSGTPATITQLVAATGAGTSHSQVSWSILGFIVFQGVGTTSTPLFEIPASCISSGPCSPTSSLDSGASSALNSDPAWSPDGTKLAYASNRGGQPTGNNVWVWDTVNHINTQISSSTSNKRSPTWSADGTQLVYVDNNTVLERVDNANATLPATPTPIHTATGGTLSVSWKSVVAGITPVPTYKALIYGGEDTGSLTVNNLFTVNPIASDAPVQVTNVGAGVGAGVGYNFPVWSPDGKSVAFSDASRNLRILNVATGATSVLPVSGISSAIAWDLNGAYQIAYTDGGGNVNLFDGVKSSAILNSVAVPNSMVSWNKNLNAITFEAPGSSGTLLESVIASCPGCTLIPALDSGANGATNSDPAWSPDGTKLAYVSNRDGHTAGTNDVYVWDTGTKVSTKVSSGASSKNSPSWNYNGTQLVYVDGLTSIEMVDQANTTSPVAPVLIHSATTGSLTSVSWSSLWMGLPTPTPVTPSPTPVAITTGSLTADNFSPATGAAVTFTFSVTNTTGLTLSSIAAGLTVNGTTAVPLSSTTAATPTAMGPGATAVFKFVYTTTANDLCSLTPLASFSGTPPAVGGVAQPPITFTTSQLTNGSVTATITEQRIGLTAAGVLPSSGNATVGQALTTTVNVTNSGCLAENVSAYTTVNSIKTSDAVTSSSLPTILLAPGNAAIFTSTHTVTSTDITTTAQVMPDNGGLAMVSMTRADRVDPNRAAARAALATSSVVVSYTFTFTNPNNVAMTNSITTTTTSYTLATTTTTPAAGTGTPTTLGLTKVASVPSIAPGGSFNYTITVTNNTGGTISALLISDSLPTNVTPGTVVVSPSTCPSTVSNGSLTVSCSSLAAAQTVSITIPVTVSKTITTGTSISNTANASYSGGNATPSTVSVAVANGATSLPVTGYESDPTSPLMLIALIIGAAVVWARHYATQQRTGASGK